MGSICMFKGNNLEDMKKVYPIKTLFEVGHADYAFNNINYPEGVKPRGSIWPFGLYICPKTHRFFVFFHNETGWNGKGSGYDSKGYCETPYFDTDFRHIGLMHSDDEGKTWLFDRWVITSEEPCFSELFHPEGFIGVGQSSEILSTGSGDFTTYIENDYLYIFYNIIRTNANNLWWESCNTYVARTRLKEDGTMGDFVKYYKGAFTEPGNMGKESPISSNTWHSRIIYSEHDGYYYMAYNPVQPHVKTYVLADKLVIKKSRNLFEWDNATKVEIDEEIHGHYFTIVPANVMDNPFVNKTNKFSVLISGSALDVKGFDIEI